MSTLGGGSASKITKKSLIISFSVQRDYLSHNKCNDCRRRQGVGTQWEVEEEGGKGDSKGGGPEAIGENLQLPSDRVSKMSN